MMLSDVYSLGEPDNFIVNIDNHIVFQADQSKLSMSVVLTLRLYIEYINASVSASKLFWVFVQNKLIFKTGRYNFYEQLLSLLNSEDFLSTVLVVYSLF